MMAELSVQQQDHPGFLGREFLCDHLFVGPEWRDQIQKDWIVSEWFAWTGIQILAAGRDIDNVINGQAEIQTGPVTPW